MILGTTILQIILIMIPCILTLCLSVQHMKKNLASNELNLAANGRHFMLPEQFPVFAGTGGDPQADSPTPSTAEPTRSVLDPAA